jgi:hypothetical protein
MTMVNGPTACEQSVSKRARYVNGSGIPRSTGVYAVLDMQCSSEL